MDLDAGLSEEVAIIKNRSKNIERLQESVVESRMAEMLIVLGVGFVACIVLILACFHALNVNNQTCAQRQEMITAIFSRGDWRHLSLLYYTVHYDKHMKELFWFRDPLAIYPPELREILTEKK